VVDGQLKSRSLKSIPNAHVSSLFSKKALDGLDGELILGSPTAKDVYRVTNGACARHEGAPPVKFYVFDTFKFPDKPFERRIEALGLPSNPDIVYVEHLRIDNERKLREYEEFVLDQGYEGLILRSQTGTYKFGRSTLREGGMLKLKRFVDGEAIIIDIEEEMENTNEAKTNELGRTKRSSAKAGLVGKGRAGTLVVVEKETGVQFRIGSGLNDADADFFWKHREEIVKSGKHIIKYKSFPVGVKDLPRHPVYLGGREAWDMS
jgi:DNA ligase-1